MDIVDGILAADPNEEDETSLLYGDETVSVALPLPSDNEVGEGDSSEAPTQKFLQESYENSQWKTSYSIMEKIRERSRRSQVYAIIVVNGSRHFNGYCLIENDYNEFCLLGEEDAKLKPLRVKWVKLCHIPYQRTTQIHNSLKDDQPVKNSLNGDEISNKSGQQLLDLINQEPPESIESQREKLSLSDSLVIALLSQTFELPPKEDSDILSTEMGAMEIVRENEKDRNKREEEAENISTTSNHTHEKEGEKRRGRGSRSRSNSRGRGGNKSSAPKHELGSSYLDMMDIVNMTYEEYLEAYRSLQIRAREEYMMSMHQPPMGPPHGMGGMMPPPHMNMPPYPDAGYYPPMGMGPGMGPMMGGPGPMMGGRGGYRGGRGY